MKARRVLLWGIVALLALLVVPVGRALWFYRAWPAARSVATPNLAGLTVPTPAAGEFADHPTAGRGLVLLDRAHDNLFSAEEIAVLTARLRDRGLATREVQMEDDLAAALRAAQALIVVNPLDDFSTEEIAAVRRFVEHGGRLLLIADPTRFSLLEDEYSHYQVVGSVRYLNPLAAAFGMALAEDYLYNVVQNEGNYQNIILEHLAPVSLTAGLSQVAFYATHSIRSGNGILYAGGDTRSSDDELARRPAVAALDRRGQVLLLGDLTFMTHPYAGVLDNGRFIANIADFLAGAERLYTVADFPYYFGDEVALVSLGSSGADTDLVATEARLQQALQAADRRPLFRAEEERARDTFFFGLFDHADGVADYLDAAGIAVEVEEDGAGEALSITLDISGTGRIATAGMALLSLHQEATRTVLLALSDDGADLDRALQALAGGGLDGCLELTEALVLCAVGEGGSGGAGGEGGGEGASILVVADDDRLAETNCYADAFYYDYALGNDYTLTPWSERQDGPPALEDLRRYDAVLWTAGNCSGTVPSEADAAMLREYVAGGGRLLIEGTSIGADWGGSDFYAEVCHAESLGSAPLMDLLVAEGTHPLARGFKAGQVIGLAGDFAGYPMDVIAAVGDSLAVLARGPASEETGAPVVLAYEGGKTRVVYSTFPIYFLPEQEMTALIRNVAAWLVE